MHSHNLRCSGMDFCAAASRWVARAPLQSRPVPPAKALPFRGSVKFTGPLKTRVRTLLERLVCYAMNVVTGKGNGEQVNSRTHI